MDDSDLVMGSVLVIEDDRSIRETLKESLELKGYEVRTARNGAEAFDILSNMPPPNVILLDLMMPVMDGYEFLSKLRASHAGQGLSATPIIVISAATGAGMAVKLLAQAFIPKPFDLDTIYKKVEEFCPATI